MHHGSLAGEGQRSAAQPIGGDRPSTGRRGERRVLREDVWQALPRDEESARRRTLGLIARAAFDSDDHPAAARADAYRQLLTAQARSLPLAEPFRARAVVYSLGDLRVGLFDAVPHRFERDRAKIAFDGIDEVAVHHVVRGHAEGSFDGSDATLAEGDVCCIDLARPATLEERGPTRAIRVSLRRRVAMEVLPGVDGLHGASIDRRGAETYLHVLYDLVPRLDTLPASEASRHAAELLGGLARCLEVAAAPPDSLGKKHRAMLDFIDSHVADRRLAPDFIAGSLRISRTTLFSAFRDWGGVERAIMQRRLDRARILLLQPGPRPSVARLARLCGFASPEHFARVFRLRYGSSPSRYDAGGDAPRPSITAPSGGASDD